MPCPPRRLALRHAVTRTSECRADAGVLAHALVGVEEPLHDLRLKRIGQLRAQQAYRGEAVVDFLPGTDLVGHGSGKLLGARVGGLLELRSVRLARRSGRSCRLRPEADILEHGQGGHCGRSATMLRGWRDDLVRQLSDA